MCLFCVEVVVTRLGFLAGRVIACEKCDVSVISRVVFGLVAC